MSASARAGLQLRLPLRRGPVRRQAYGAERTPEVFLFDGDRRLVYHGAIDDSRNEDAVTTHYLRDAIDAVLAGHAPETADTMPVGCSVKFR